MGLGRFSGPIQEIVGAPESLEVEELQATEEGSA